MKRFSVLVIIFLTTSGVFAQSNDLSPWSFTAELGLSSLDGDGDSNIKPAYGASVEYAVFPFAGISVDYNHFPLSGQAFSTNLNTAGVNLTFNINRLVFSRTDDNIIVKGYLGYGLAGYSYKYNPNTPLQSTGFKTAFSFPVVAMSVEYNLIETLSAGIKAQFRPFNVNNLEGDPRYNLDNVNNDNIVAASLFLRIKLYSAN